MGRLGVALALSLGMHLLVSGWPMTALREDTPATPLAVRLSKMPPPPVLAQAKPPTPRAHRRSPPRKVLTKPANASSPRPAIADEAPAFSPLPPVAVAATTPLAPPEAPSPPPPPSPHRLPPSHFELVYTLNYGDQGFMVGGSHYRFHHADGKYELEYWARARGLARIAYRGTYKMESRGSISSDGLRPSEFVLERGGPDKREVAHFDWESKTLRLADDKTLPLEPLTFDLLSFLLQFYFVPPESNVLQFHVVRPTKVYDFVFERVGEDTIDTAMGSIPAQHWKRRAGEDELAADLWLSPDFHYIPVKIHVRSPERGSGEEILQGIFADPPDDAGTP